MLWSAGYNVLEATTGTEAIQVGARNEKGVDLLLSDVAVPERSGTEVALELSASHPSMVVLFVSGTRSMAGNRPIGRTCAACGQTVLRCWKSQYYPRYCLKKLESC